MARTKTKPVSRRARHETEIRRLVVLDALRGMAGPGLAAAAILILWVLFNAELMNVGPALTATGVLVLFIIAHFGVRDFLSEHTPMTVAAFVAAFACIWMIGMGWPLYATINPGLPLFAGELQPGAAPSTVPLRGDAGQYRVVVTGHLPAGSDRANHEGQYNLRVQDDAGLDRLVHGELSESWQRKRIGRRGNLPVRVAHNVAQHRIESDSGHDLSIRLLDLTGDAGRSLSVEVFKQAVSTVVLTTIGVVLTAGALVVDAWRADVAYEGLMTIQTVAVLAGLAAFRAFGSAHAGFGDLLINGLLGAVPGAGVGTLLWRVAGARVRKALPRPR